MTYVILLDESLVEEIFLLGYLVVVDFGSPEQEIFFHSHDLFLDPIHFILIFFKEKKMERVSCWSAPSMRELNENLDITVNGSYQQAPFYRRRLVRMSAGVPSVLPRLAF